MTDLSHWDFVEHFSGYEAAALILGLEPRQSNDETVRVITGRMERDYQNAIDHRPWDVSGNPLENQVVQQGTDHRQILLISADMEELHQFFSLPGTDPQRYEIEWRADRSHLKFSNQKFSRKQLTGWLKAIGMKSVYQFALRNDSTTPTAIAQSDPDIDPFDLPPELDIANIAWRSVQNGYGLQSDTPRNRLIDYLGKNYKMLKPEAVQRIATVANPDKSPGRKKRDKE